MTTPSINVNNNYTKIAGITYALIIIVAMFPPMIFDIGSLLKAPNAVDNFVGQEGVIRLSITFEFLMFFLVMVLSWVLYVLLKPVNKNLALLGLIFRFGEALLGLVVIMFYLSILMLLSGAEYLQAFESAQLQAVALFFLKLGSGAGYNILLFIMGVGGIAYCYLFFISNYIPRVLSIWGIITYSTMVLYGFINITIHNAPSELAYTMVPGALFELLVGLWLFFKGITVNPKQIASGNY